MITSQDIHWSAGFLDGEAYFGINILPSGRKVTARISATQKDEWHIRKLEQLFGGSVIQTKAKVRDEVRLYWRWEVYGNKAIGVMMTIYSLMSPRRQERILAAINQWKDARFYNIGSYNSDKTHCKRGHEFTPENTYAKCGKYRQCRICQSANELKSRIARGLTSKSI